MPELPEVETVMQGLKPALEGRRIARVELRREGLRFPFPTDFVDTLKDAAITHLERRSKYILWHVQTLAKSRGVIISHLGMTGRFSWVSIPPEGYIRHLQKHDHVLYYLDDGNCLIYNDARRFGVMDYCRHDHLVTHKLLAGLGAEPLTRGFHTRYLQQSIARKTAAIKPVIMDAAVVVGVGNIYASEACFMAGIHPATPACDVARDAKQAQALVNAIKKVLKAAIAAGGSSVKNFLHVDGHGGYFQHQFQVYGRKHLPCLRCGDGIHHIMQAGRSTFYCPGCQAK